MTEPGSDRPPPRMGRRQALAALAAIPLLCRGADAREEAEERARSARGAGGGLITRDQMQSVDRAVRWLGTDRQRRGGYWGDERETRVADTALAVLALMAAGNTVSAGRSVATGNPDSRAVGPPRGRGPYAENVRKGIAYLARIAWSDDLDGHHGYIHDDDKSKMHGHGFATLALAEAVGNLGPRSIRDIRASLADGMDPAQLSLADQVRHGLERAVALIERSQDRDSGGWLYYPWQQGHEGSMTVTQITALRAAQNAGVRVNGAVLSKAYDYVRASQNLSRGENHGGFAYQKDDKRRVSYALTAAALTTLFGLGRYGRKEEDAAAIRMGLEFMDNRLHDTLKGSQWFYYSMFYGAQAVYLAQDTRRLETHWPQVRAAVMARQSEDGRFRPVQNDSRSEDYTTAIACLTLQVPTETLPILQRR